MTQPLFLGNDIYRGSTFGRRHPLAIPRVPTVTDLSRALGWLGPHNYRTSPRLRPAALTAFHTPDYVAALQAAEASQTVTDEVRRRHGLGTLSNPVYPEMFRRPATGAGGALLAAAAHRTGIMVGKRNIDALFGYPTEAAQARRRVAPQSSICRASEGSMMGIPSWIG